MRSGLGENAKREKGLVGIYFIIGPVIDVFISYRFCITEETENRILVGPTQHQSKSKRMR